MVATASVPADGGFNWEPKIRTLVPAYGDQFSCEQVMSLVVDCLWQSGLVLGKSDCGYALWALAGFPKALEKLDFIRNDWTTELPLSVSSVTQAEEYVDFGTVHRRLAYAAWPGGLTLVAPAHGR